MNDDPTSTPAAVRRPDTGNHISSEEAAEFSNEETARTRMRRRNLEQIKRKAEFIRDIMSNLDILIYAELCVLYYMDCSFFRFILRVIVQVMFLTPGPDFLPPTTKHRPYIGALLGGNALCILLHIFSQRPEAGELTRGYLHGSIIIDFIGQKGPTSKIHLVILDLLVTALQSFMVAVHIEEMRLKDVLKVPDSLLGMIVTAATFQDHDAEERGVIREAGTSSEDIELQEIQQSRRGDVPHNGNERNQLLSSAVCPGDGEPLDGPLDLYYSGNIIVGEFHVLHTLRSQWANYDRVAGTALQTVGNFAGYHSAQVNHHLRRLERL